MATYKQKVPNQTFLVIREKLNYNYNEISLAKIKKANQQIITPLILASAGENVEPTELGCSAHGGELWVSPSTERTTCGLHTLAAEGPSAHSRV